MLTTESSNTIFLVQIIGKEITGMKYYQNNETTALDLIDMLYFMVLHCDA